MLSALARGCEVALDSARGELWDATQHLTPLDISFFRREGVNHAKLRMRKRKDLRVLRGKHSLVYLAGGGKFIDAPRELMAWMMARSGIGLADSSPLFCDEHGSCITVEQVRDEVKRLMRLIGRDPALYGAHSLRIGGATAALAAGVPPQLIRLMGRWSSDVYEIYTRLSIESALATGTALASATVTGTTGAFTEEHFELLPEEVAETGRMVGGGGVEDGEDGVGSEEEAAEWAAW